MICRSCKTAADWARDSLEGRIDPPIDAERLAELHYKCPEVARHDSANRESDVKAGPDALTLEDVTLLGSQWCECQHKPVLSDQVLARS